MLDMDSYLLGITKGTKNGVGVVDLEGGISITEDADGFIVIEEAQDGE